MKTKVSVLVLLLGLAAAGFWARNRHAQEADKDRPLILYGNVDIRELTLAFRLPGRLEAMSLEEGDRVVAGEAIASLDRKPFQDELAVREAQLREAEAALVNAEKRFERLDALLRNKSVSQSDYDDALATRDEVRAKVDTARALLDQSRTDLADSVLASPSGGTVLTRVCEPGAIVAAGQTVYSVSLDRPVWIRAYVEEPWLGLIHGGQEVLVRTDSGSQYRGQIGFISPRAEFTPKTVETQSLRTSLVYRLRVVVDNPDQGLRQGMPVTAEILGAWDR